MTHSSIRRVVEFLRERELPILSPTVRSILRLTDSDQSSASELAQAVLRDPPMTTRILKLVNAVYFNPGGREVTTISRAVVVLGFGAIRNLALSAGLMDVLCRARQQDRLLTEMARSFHAAVQARALAVAKGQGDQAEEVFIATLLYRIGAMSFWAFSEKGGDKLDAALVGYDDDPARLERELLGFSFQDLSLAISREWHLSELLEDALEQRRRSQARSACVRFGQSVALAAEHGWESEQMKVLTRDLSAFLGLRMEAVDAQLHQGARDALALSELYGAERVKALIPTPDAAPEPGISGLPKSHNVVAVDATVRDHILQELDGLLQTNPDPNLILPMVLEGMVRGMGLDRAVFAMLTPDRRRVHAKIALGWDHEHLLSHFDFPIAADAGCLIGHCLDKGLPCWLDEGSLAKKHHLLPTGWRKTLGEGPFFLMPARIRGTTIGLILADRQPTRRPLDQTAFDGFHRFGAYLNDGLASRKGHS